MQSGIARLIVSSIAVFIALLPLKIESLPESLHESSIWLYGGFVWMVEFFYLLKPDERFEAARQPTLDFMMSGKFDEYRPAKKGGQSTRMPFRVNIMRSKWTISGPRMCMCYMYGFHKTDADHGMSFEWRTGLCWRVKSSGAVGWFDRSAAKTESFGMTKDQKDKTNHVFAVLSIPLRRYEEHRVRAVLNIDALTADAAKDLERWKDELKTQQSTQLSDLAELAALYV